MRGGRHTELQHMKLSFYSTILFLLFSNQITQQFLQSMMDGSVSILHNGLLTPVGLIFQAILFFFSLLALFQFQTESV